VKIPEPDLKSPTWPFVLAFAKRMEYKLSLNRHKGDREGWSSMDFWALMDCIDEEVEEVSQCEGMGIPADDVANECADVANFCMMLADNVTRGG
jgi:hypothetical protein